MPIAQTKHGTATYSFVVGTKVLEIVWTRFSITRTFLCSSLFCIILCRTTRKINNYFDSFACKLALLIENREKFFSREFVLPVWTTKHQIKLEWLDMFRWLTDQTSSKVFTICRLFFFFQKSIHSVSIDRTKNNSSKPKYVYSYQKQPHRKFRFKTSNFCPEFNGNKTKHLEFQYNWLDVAPKKSEMIRSSNNVMQQNWHFIQAQLGWSTKWCYNSFKTFRIM